MDEKKQSFALLKQISKTIVNTFQRNCEVAIHDFANLHKSLVHLEGNVTGRRIGAPSTDLVLKALRQEGRDIKDRYNYKTTTKDGRTLKSSTAFIRSNEGEVIGAFCINFDATDYLNATQALEVFTKSVDFIDPGNGETFASSIGETIGVLFEQALAEVGKQPASMTTEEKTQLVRVLERKGAFQIKQGVDHVAVLLGVSKYTVYNYLQKVRAEHGIKKI